MKRLPYSRVPARTLVLRLLASSLLLVLVLVIPSSSQAQRRDFSASYRITNVVETMDSVSLKLTLTIHNSSGNDITNGAVALYSSEGPSSKQVDAFDAIKRFPSYKHVTISREFTISKHDYERWSLGESPNVKLLLPDVESGTRVVPIDLSRQPGFVALAQ